MSVRDLVPWGRGNNQTPSLYHNGDFQQHHPILSLHREMNRLFDEVFRDFDMRLPLVGNPLSRVWPNVEISESDKEIRVTAEIPGLEEKDIELVLEDDVLTLRGEKRSETQDNERQFSERYYGSFERRIPLSTDVERDEVHADFKNGVLTVILPKSAKAQSQTKRIAINS